MTASPDSPRSRIQAARGRWLSLGSLLAIVGVVWYLELAEPTPLRGILRVSHGWSAPVYGFALWLGLNFVAANCRPLPSEHAGAGSSASRRVVPGLVLLPVSALLGAALAASPALGWEQASLWAGAQYGAALWALMAILVLYWNCFEIYWDLLWHCPILALEFGLLVGMPTGFVLPGYGLVNLFWGDGYQPGGAVIVPMLSASMITLSIAVFLLCGYFSSTIMFDQTLVGEVGLDRDGQISRRVNDLWQELLPGAGPGDHYSREPGHFVWWCLRPVLLLLAIPAAFPALAVDRLLSPVSRAGWIIGLAAAGWAIRWLLIDRGLVRRVAELTSSGRPAEHSPPGQEPAYDFPLTINARGLLLITIPLLIALLAAHAFDITRDYRTRPGVCILGGLLTISGVAVLWSLRWPSRILRRYALWTGAAILVPTSLSGAASWLGGLYIAAPFSICWLLMAVAIASTLFVAVVSGFVFSIERRAPDPGTPADPEEARARAIQARRRARLIRRTIQVSALVLLVALLQQNGRMQVRSMTSTDVAPDLALYDAWFERYMTDAGRPIHSRFGSPQLKDSADEEILGRWREGASRLHAASDEPMPVGIWHRVPGEPRPLADEVEARPEAALATRIEDRQAKPKLVVVAVSGGGLRAGIWSEKVLYELEKAIPEFPDRTRLITGSSGGMLGAARYVAGLSPATPSGFARTPDEAGSAEESAAGLADLSSSEVRRAPIDARVGRELRKDYLTPVIHRMVFGDVEMLNVPGLTPADRGMVLEDGFLLDGRPGSLLNTTFEGLARKGEAEGRIPSLVFSPMMVEDSRRLIISNLDLGPLILNHGSFDKYSGSESYEPGPDFPFYSCTGVQFFHLYPAEYSKLKLGTAVRMNATFPYVTPAVSMPLRRQRRVVDAGYYDNYGVDLAVGWLEQHRRWLEANTSGVILIQVRAFSNETLLKRLEPAAPGDGFGWLAANVLDPLARGAQFLTTPLAGIGTARMNVNYYRNDAAVESLKRSFTFDMLERLSGIQLKDGRARPRPYSRIGLYSAEEKSLLEKTYPAASTFFRVITFTCSNEKPHPGALPVQETLSWYLSEAEFDSIVGNWHTVDNYRRFQYLKAIFRRFFETDLDSAYGDRKARPGPWSSRPPRLRLDPRHRSTIPSSVRGREYLTAAPPGPGEAGAEVHWDIERVPPGTYKLSINLPSAPDTGLEDGSLASGATYTVAVTSGGRTTVEPIAFALRDRLARGPDDRPDYLLDYDDPDARGDLGRWFVLTKGLVITETATVRVGLTNAGVDGTIIADAVRLE